MHLNWSPTPSIAVPAIGTVVPTSEPIYLGGNGNATVFGAIDEVALSTGPSSANMFVGILDADYGRCIRAPAGYDIDYLIIPVTVVDVVAMLLT